MRDRMHPETYEGNRFRSHCSSMITMEISKTKSFHTARNDTKYIEFYLCQVYPFETEENSMAKGTIKTNAMRILDREKIEYQQHQYEASDHAIDGISVAMKMGRDPKQVFKTLVTQGHSKQYYVFVIPVAKELQLKEAAKAVGEKSVEMIPVSQINQVTGYIRGGCSPIGMKKQYPTVLDCSCEGLETMIFSGGKIGFQIEMRPMDLKQLIGATIAPIAE